MKNYHYRSNYESLLFRLMDEVGHEKHNYTLSKRELFQNINYYLIQLGCVPFRQVEIDKIILQ